ncbi:hypothetical protein [Kitasatospora azatica]|uniref:hypothetical protein n=1 Tax=Kitasatospora azatica TaxID=58347 RepID=UPI000565990D|nr:hypothetical protein [Kitasatospora azatica]
MSTTTLLVLGLLLERPMTPSELATTLAERAAESPLGGALPAPGEPELAAVAAELRSTGLTDGQGALTDRGRAEFEHRVGELLATPAEEQPAFFTAVGYLGALDRSDALAGLRLRSERLRERAGQLAAARAAGTGIPRLFLIETEYAHRMCLAELAWVQEVLGEIGAGTLAWPRIEVTERGWEWGQEPS